MTDLVSARYGQTNPLYSILGGLSNVVQSDIPARSNLEYFGLGGLSDGALAATGVAAFVPIPVDVGTVVSRVLMPAGATAEGTGTQAFAAIYSGIAVPALIGQSTSQTGAAFVAASAMATFTLTAAQVITSAMAPNGYIYAGVSVTATVVPTAASVSTPAAVGYQWTTTAPLFFAATAGTALGGTAAPTIVSPAAKAVAPVLILT